MYAKFNSVYIILFRFMFVCSTGQRQSAILKNAIGTRVGFIRIESPGNLNGPHWRSFFLFSRVMFPYEIDPIVTLYNYLTISTGALYLRYFW